MNLTGTGHPPVHKRLLLFLFLWSALIPSVPVLLYAQDDDAATVSVPQEAATENAVGTGVDTSSEETESEQQPAAELPENRIESQQATPPQITDPHLYLEIELPLVHRGIHIADLPFLLDPETNQVVALHVSGVHGILGVLRPEPARAVRKLAAEYTPASSDDADTNDRNDQNDVNGDNNENSDITGDDAEDRNNRTAPPAHVVPWIPVFRFADLDVGLELDPVEVVVVLVVPRHLEAPLEYSLVRPFRPDPALLIESPPFSAFLNLYGSLDRQDRETTLGAEEAWPRRLGFDLGGASGRFSALTASTLDSEAEEPFELDRAILRYDLPEHRIRAEAGTLAVPQTGLLGTQNIIGASVLRDFSLDPYYLSQSQGVVDLYLERPSEISIYVNGRLIEKRAFPAGPVSLQDYPLSTGINQVELEITDNVGRTETVALSMPFAAGLLRPGTFSFLGAGGVYRLRRDFEQETDQGLQAVTGAVRYGVLPRVTVGGGFQSDADENLAAAELTVATAAGNIRTDVAAHLLNNQDDARLSSAARLEYGLGFPMWRLFPRVTLGIRTQEPGFRTPAPTEPRENIEATRLYGTVSQSLGRVASVSANAARSWNRESNPDRTSIGFLLSASVTRGGSFTFRINYDFYDNDTSDFRGSIAYVHVFGSGNATTRLAHNLADNTTEAQGRVKFEPSDSQTVNLRAGVQGFSPEPDGPWRADGSVQYYSPITESSLSHVSVSQPEFGFTSHTTSARVSSAVVFADGAVSLSRPVRDSFVIIRRHPRFSDVDIEIRSNRSSGTFPVYFWGTGVIPNLRSYQFHSIMIDAPFLPDGYDLGKRQHWLQPGYLHGTVIQVGTDATVYGDGVLVDAEGEPIALKTGVVQDEDGQETLFFTDWTGTFVLYGLRSGTGYTVRLNDGRTGRFTVPPDSEGIRNLGQINME
jgi:outer membrane usher protein